jgi:hypothetical protein
MSDEPAATEGAKKPPPKRSWTKDHGVVRCFSSPAGDCLVWTLVDLPEVSDFYDPELGRGTQEMNRVFHAHAEARRGMELAVIVVLGGPMLVWIQPGKGGPNEDGAVGPNDDPETIRQAFGLTATKGAKKLDYTMTGPHEVVCFTSNVSKCVVSKFWEPVGTTGSFYDADLARATREANAILDGLRAATGPRRELSFIVVGNALLLIWTHPGIGSGDEPHVIRQALGLNH